MRVICQRRRGDPAPTRRTVISDVGNEGQWDTSHSAQCIIREGMIAKRILDGIVRNKYADDPGQLAAWLSASQKGRGLTCNSGVIGPPVLKPLSSVGICQAFDLAVPRTFKIQLNIKRPKTCSGPFLLFCNASKAGRDQTWASGVGPTILRFRRIVDTSSIFLQITYRSHPAVRPQVNRFNIRLA